MTNFLKRHKKDIFVWGLVLLIFGLIVLIVYYENQDKKHYTNVVCNSDINIVDDEINLDKNYYIDDNGNLVSNNLLNTSNIVNGFYDTNTYFVNSFNVSSGYLYISNLTTNQNSGVSLNVNVAANTNYTFKSQVSNRTRVVISSFVNGQENVLVDNLNYNGEAITFTTLSDNLWFIFYAFYSSDITWNEMALNVGSSSLPYEPFGTWFKNEGQNYSVLYNIFNNSVGKLYRSDNDVLVLSENIVLSASDVSITFGNFPNIFDYLNSYDSEDTSTYPTQYFYFTLDLSTSTNSPLVFSLNNSILDTDISLFYNDVKLGTFSRDNDPYHVFVNQDSNYTFNSISFDGIYLPDYAYLDFNISSSGILYNKGYDDGVNSIKYDYQSLQNQYGNLTTQYSTLDSNYQSLLEQYNALNSDEYSLSELIWSIGSVPFAVLTSGFNVNVMGISLASIITGLFTSMLLIWIIKKFFR